MNKTTTNTVGRIARPLAAVLAPALLVGACSSAASSTSGSAATSSTTSTTPAATSSASSASADQATPAAALIEQLQQIVNGDYSAVCQQMGKIAAAMPTPTSIPSSTCISTLTDLHENFATDGLTKNSTFTVDPVKATGDNATISGTNVHVAGSTLTALMIAHSTGVQSGQFDISFQVQRISGAWYVTNMNMNLG
jgi:hypothetical protein